MAGEEDEGHLWAMLAALTEPGGCPSTRLAGKQQACKGVAPDDETVLRIPAAHGSSTGGAADGDLAPAAPAGSLPQEGHAPGCALESAVSLPVPAEAAAPLHIVNNSLFADGDMRFAVYSPATDGHSRLQPLRLRPGSAAHGGAPAATPSALREQLRGQLTALLARGDALDALLACLTEQPVWEVVSGAWEVLSAYREARKEAEESAVGGSGSATAAPCEQPSGLQADADDVPLRGGNDIAASSLVDDRRGNPLLQSQDILASLVHELSTAPPEDLLSPWTGVTTPGETPLSRFQSHSAFVDPQLRYELQQLAAAAPISARGAAQLGQGQGQPPAGAVRGTGSIVSQEAAAAQPALATAPATAQPAQARPAPEPGCQPDPPAPSAEQPAAARPPKRSGMQKMRGLLRLLGRRCS